MSDSKQSPSPASKNNSAQSVNERRLRLLHKVVSRTAAAQSTDEACRLALEALAEFTQDIPFALLYRFAEGGTQAVLQAYAGSINEKHPPTVDMVSGASGWEESLSRLYRDRSALHLPETLLLPLCCGGAPALFGALAVGVPRDDSECAFWPLLARTIEGALTHMHRYEQEKMRADALAREAAAERERLLSVFAQAPVAVGLMEGPDHVFAMANSTYFSLFFGGERELIGKPVRETVPEAGSQGYFELLDRVYRTGEPYVGRAASITLRQVDGSSRDIYLNFIYQPLRDEEGVVTGILAVAMDVTEQVLSRQAAEAAEARARQLAASIAISEERLNLSLESAKMGFWDWDAKTGYTTLSRTLMEEWGIDPETFQHTLSECLDRIHPQDRATVWREIERATSGQRSYDVEYRVLHPSGEVLWINAKGRFYLDEANAPQRLTGVTINVTERKRSAQALRESERNLRAIVEQMPVGLIMVEAPDGRIVLGNRELPRIFRHEVRSAAGVPDCQPWKGFHPDGRPYATHEWPVARSVLKGEVVLGEVVKIERGDGTSGVVSINSAPVIDDEGSVTAAVAIVTDITSYIQTQEDLRAVIKSRDDFLSIASHELKTPMTSLKMQLQMAQRSVKPEANLAPSPDRLARVFDISIKQVERLTTLIDDLLDVSRIESGKLSFNFELVDVAQLVAEVADRFAEQFKSAQGAVEFSLLEPALIEVDRFRIEQVVINLLSNAAKYGAGKTVKISVQSTPRGACLQVQDFGIGIAPENQTKIFDRFERVITHSNVSGLGLGLYITKQIVEAHQGTIELRSELGRGSTFTVRLPARNSN